MGLVDYSSSESEEEESQPLLKRPRLGSKSLQCKEIEPAELPPLPDSFRDLYAVKARVTLEDDPSLHHGRKRTTPHAEGSWPTHVYLEWCPSSEDLILLSQLTTQVGSTTNCNITSLLKSELDVPLPLHISLSAPLVLQTHQRDEFFNGILAAVKDVTNTNESEKRKECPKAFDLHLDGLKWAPNHERTRWFLAAGIARPKQDVLNRLLKACNDVASIHGLPKLYAAMKESRATAISEGPLTQRTPSDAGQSIPNEFPEDYTDRFHFSLAWTLDTPTSIHRTGLISKAPQDLTKLSEIVVSIRSVKVKIGNVIRSIPLD